MHGYTVDNDFEDTNVQHTIAGGGVLRVVQVAPHIVATFVVRVCSSFFAGCLESDTKPGAAPNSSVRKASLGRGRNALSLVHSTK